MLIKNEKIGQNFRKNTKIRQKSNKKSSMMKKLKNHF